MLEDKETAVTSLVGGAAGYVSVDQSITVVTDFVGTDPVMGALVGGAVVPIAAVAISGYASD